MPRRTRFRWTPFLKHQALSPPPPPAIHSCLEHISAFLAQAARPLPQSIDRERLTHRVHRVREHELNFCGSKNVRRQMLWLDNELIICECYQTPKLISKLPNVTRPMIKQQAFCSLFRKRNVILCVFVAEPPQKMSSKWKYFLSPSRNGGILNRMILSR